MHATTDSSLTRRDMLKRAALLLGAAISPSILEGVLRAQATRATGAATPRFLTAKQFAAVGAIAERILPRTDTPGALDVGVPAFVDLMFGEFMTVEEKQRLTAGLTEIESASTKAHQQRGRLLHLAGGRQLCRTMGLRTTRGPRPLTSSAGAADLDSERLASRS